MGVSDSQIYASLKDDLIRYATALVGPDAAGDVVSTVVVRILSKGSLGDLREPRAYLFRAVLNEATSARRRETREVPGDVLETSRHDPEIDPEVLAAVLGLPVQQRAATYLVYWLGHTMAEAAALMGLGEGTVKRYVSLARTNLREALHARA